MEFLRQLTFENERWTKNFSTFETVAYEGEIEIDFVNGSDCAAVEVEASSSIQVFDECAANVRSSASLPTQMNSNVVDECAVNIRSSPSLPFLPSANGCVPPSPTVVIESDPFEFENDEVPVSEGISKQNRGKKGKKGNENEPTMPSSSSLQTQMNSNVVDRCVDAKKTKGKSKRNKGERGKENEAVGFDVPPTVTIRKKKKKVVEREEEPSVSEFRAANPIVALPVRKRKRNN